MVFKSLLARLGIGSAKINMELPDREVRQGDEVEVEVSVEGGWIDQKAQKLYFDLEEVVQTDEGQNRIRFDRQDIAEGFKLESGEQKDFKVNVNIPYNTPLTSKGKTVCAESAIDFAGGIDSKDRYQIEVRPSSKMEDFINSMEDLGFQLHSISSKRKKGRFIQELGFKPVKGDYKGDLDELEAVIKQDSGQLEAKLEIDQKGGFLSEATDLDESKETLSYKGGDKQGLIDKIRDRINRNI